MYTVVVADDEYELRRAIIQKVQWSTIGFEVIGEAENGVEALELVECLEPDLLLTDIKMPFISGIDLARKAREIRPAMQIAFLSGYDDFSYAQQAIQYNIIKYLLKPISSIELTNELKDIKDKMDAINKIFTTTTSINQEQLLIETLLMPLLLDNVMIDEKQNNEYLQQVNKQAVELHLRSSIDDKSKYMVVITRLFNQEGNNVTSSQHVLAINSILKKYVRCGSFYSGKKIVSLLSGMPWELEKYINILVNEIVQSSERSLHVTCCIGVSEMINRLTKANIAYLEACNASEYQQENTSNITFIKDIERNDSIKYEYVEEIANKIEILLKSGTDEELETYISSAFINFINEQVSRVDIDLLLMKIISLVYNLIYSVCDNKSSTAFFEQYAQLSKIFNQHSFNEKRKDICLFCITAKDLINYQKKANSEVICDELMSIINNEYGDEELTLTVVSDKLHVSASYLSALVKKSKGESFITLLTKKRMEIAKDMVLFSGAKILEIAYKCGYNDQHYFSYCFKKQFGLSPNKMREKQQHREEVTNEI